MQIIYLNEKIFKQPVVHLGNVNFYVVDISVEDKLIDVLQVELAHHYKCCIGLQHP